MEAKKQRKRLQGLLPPAQQHPHDPPSQVFAEHVLKQTVAQILLASGMQTCESVALDVLTEACKRKLKQIGSELKQISERSRRTQVLCEDLLLLQSPNNNNGGGNLDLSDLTFFTEIPAFPVQVSFTPEGSAAAAAAAVTEEPTTTCGLSHLPPFPPAHTYKRTKLIQVTEQAEVPSATINELRRVQQRYSALVRESLAAMQRESGGK